MTQKDAFLLADLHASAARGAFSTEVRGKDGLASAHALEEAGLAEWKGSYMGSEQYAITPAGETEYARRANP